MISNGSSIMSSPESGDLDPLLDDINEPAVVIGSVSPKPRRWPQILATLVVCLSPLSMGLVLGFSSPTIQRLEDDGLLIGNDEVSWFGSLITLGAIAGGPLAGLLIEKAGRKTTLMLSNLPYSVGWFLIIAAHGHYGYLMLYVGRILTGIGMGMTSLSAPTYIAEISTKELRGTLGCAFQLYVTLGILLAFVLGINLNARWLSMVCSSVPALMVLLMLCLPETPRWLFSKGIRTSGLAAIRWLRGPDYDVEEESLEIEANIQMLRGQRVTPREFLSTSSLLKPLIISLGLMFFQQTSGINCVIFYANDIFSSAGYESNPHLPTVIVASVMFVTTILACILMDVAGRRVLLLVGSFAMTLSHIALGLFHYYHDVKKIPTDLSWLPLCSLIVFIVAFSLGWGPIPWLVMSEIFPVQVRGIASSIATIFNWTMAFIVTWQFANMKEVFQPYGTFWFFGGWCLLSGIYVAAFLPETKGKSLEEIQEYFEGQT